MEFETSVRFYCKFRKSRLKFTPLEFETCRKQVRYKCLFVKIYSVGV
ncbi:hypothetical protein CAMRE0001_0218 [Campylobacter rectus RM3267]|uniref:Uncharacterized protein n=1 Tax=Campylobacter rectus RM3267 TaxID=553218 RepID=B9CY23_CAMRE|nr:hypothetical protein CAMRE0001_0218 [Campylobacter rectus RM3267]